MRWRGLEVCCNLRLGEGHGRYFYILLKGKIGRAMGPTLRFLFLVHGGMPWYAIT